ncbi:MAG: site-specific DNA-methyltransferase [Candidatus Aenigmarchaeota archaeon]|nr:site-specific DNA-methyltransferase [Candidatus Aenigmarchaeota archaeon]
MKDIEEFKNKIICGDSFSILKKIPDNSIDCIITSPPYWSCRSYLPETDENKKFEIGLEDHPQEYIDKIVEISLECIRVLKKTGVFFLNLGDVFYTSSHQGGTDRLNKEFNKIYNHRVNIRGKYKDNWLQQKGRLLLPMRIAIELQNRGVIIRDVIIWAKKITKYPEKTSIGTAMPFPVRDRLLHAFEYIFQIVKSKKYYFDLSQIKTQIKRSSSLSHQNPMVEAYKEDNPHKKTMAEVEKFRKRYSIASQVKNWNIQLSKELSGANPTNVLMFKVENQYSVPSGHYAKFPTSLAEFFILAGCPKDGIVLDPFCGSGTTCVVAKNLGRNYIGIDLNPKYCEIAEKRLENTQSPLAP